MSETLPSSTERHPLEAAPGHRPERGLVRELRLLAAHRTLVVANVLLVTVAAIVFSLLAREMFEAETSLLPAGEQRGSLGGIGQLLSNLPIQGANLPGVTTTTDLLAGILRSRRIQAPIVREFELVDAYNVDHESMAVFQLNERLETGVSDEGILHVRFRDPDPEKAAAILNRLIAELNHYNVNVRATQSRRLREFIQTRLDETMRALAMAEERLQTFQETNPVTISPQDMANAASMGALIARRLTLKVEMEAASQIMGTDAPPYLQRKIELEALDGEIALLPELGVTAVRYYRDLKVQEQAFVYLSAQVEQARIEEKRDLPVIEVLDPAQAPVIRVWPRRKMIVLSAFVVAVAGSLFLVHVLDFLRRERATLRAIVSGS